MTPISRLTPEIKQQRREAYFAGYTTSHWPELVQISGPSSLLRHTFLDRYQHRHHRVLIISSSATQRMRLDSSKAAFSGTQGTRGDRQRCRQARAS
jgi:hypothetical protein